MADLTAAGPVALWLLSEGVSAVAHPDIPAGRRRRATPVIAPGPGLQTRSDRAASNGSSAKAGRSRRPRGGLALLKTAASDDGARTASRPP